MSLSQRIGLVVAVILTVVLGGMMTIVLGRVESAAWESAQHQVAEARQIFIGSVSAGMAQGITDVSMYLAKARQLDDFKEVQLTASNAVRPGSESSLDSVQVEALRTKQGSVHEEHLHGETIAWWSRSWRSRSACNAIRCRWAIRLRL